MNRNRYQFWTLIALSTLLIFSASTFAGCDDEDSSTNNNNTSSGTDDTGTSGDGQTTGDGSTSGSTSGDTSGTQVCTTEGCDSDSDGITDVVEAASGTDHANPDSDGDGLCDGNKSVPGVCESGEDLNANGIKDEFEFFDPRDSDSNDNGILDGDEPIGTGIGPVCNAETYGAIQAKPARSARTNLALPTSFTIVEHEAAQASSFSDPAKGIYGYAVKRTFAQGAAQAFRDFETKISTAGSKRKNAIWKLFTSWLGREDGLDRNAAQSKGSFEFGTGTDNPGVTSQDPAALRDQIISALSGSTVTTAGVSGTPCTNIISHHVEEKRDANTLVTIGVVACQADYSASDTTIFFEDILNSTLFAVAEETRAYAPNDIGCEALGGQQGGGLVDFIWVIDNSGSMADEQDNVAATAASFMDLLSSTSVDWRLAVTTTDAYCLGLDRNDPNLNPVYQLCFQQLDNDPERDKCTGLRGLNGFMSASTPNVRGEFEDLVTKNSTCLNPQGAAPGSNVCGFGLESGLLTAQFVLDQLLKTDLGIDCPSGPAYQLRKGTDQKTVLIWVTDEEDQEMKVRTGNTDVIMAADDPTRISKTEAFVQLFTQTYATNDGLDLKIYSIAGDRGVANGGVCQPLPPGAIEGAEEGLSYNTVAEAAGGAVGTICSDDLSITIQTIIRDTIGQVSSYPLPEGSVPITSSIRIAVKGQIIGRVDNGTDPYWEYVADSNAITFFRTAINEGDIIAIAYKGWVPVEQ